MGSQMKRIRLDDKRITNEITLKVELRVRTTEIDDEIAELELLPIPITPSP